MKIRLAYSREEELRPLLPLFEGKINNRGFDFEIEKIKQDEIKFNIDKFDLLYLPLPLLAVVKGLKVISNGSYAVEKLYIRRTNEENNVLRLYVNGTNSTEFYLVKMFINMSVIPSFNENNALIDYNEGTIDLYKEWEAICGKLPIVISVLGSKNLKEEELLKLKVVIRDSASVMVNLGQILNVSKELGLKGREALDCFFKLCKEKGLCGEANFSLI